MKPENDRNVVGDGEETQASRRWDLIHSATMAGGAALVGVWIAAGGGSPFPSEAAEPAPTEANNNASSPSADIYRAGADANGVVDVNDAYCTHTDDEWQRPVIIDMAHRGEPILNITHHFVQKTDVDSIGEEQFCTVGNSAYPEPAYEGLKFRIVDRAP